MSDELNALYRDLMASMEATGLRHLPDDLCCQILAACHRYGSESMTFDRKFTADLFIARERLNLFTAGIPTPELVPLLQKYIHELEGHGAPEWIAILKARYPNVVFGESG